MKIAAGKAAQFSAAPDSNLAAILIYGRIDVSVRKNRSGALGSVSVARPGWRGASGLSRPENATTELNTNDRAGRRSVLTHVA